MDTQSASIADYGINNPVANDRPPSGNQSDRGQIGPGEKVASVRKNAAERSSSLPGKLSTGYRVKNERLYRLWNLLLVIPLIGISLPIFAVISVLLLLTQGRPIFYSGTRLGQKQRPFNIYKFRTLDPSATALTQNNVLPLRSNAETPLGSLLREVRLDELPQLYNVLRGEMNMIGPRPVRPEIAEKLVCTIPNYLNRFLVKPGLVGYTQALMSHRTSKRLRSLYNSLLMQRDASVWKEVIILLRVGFRIVCKTAELVLTYFVGAFRRGSLKERRLVRRVQVSNSKVCLRNGHGEIPCGYLSNINDEAFILVTDSELNGKNYTFVLTRFVKNRNREKRAVCQGVVERIVSNNAAPSRTNGTQESEGESKPFQYLIRYRPATELNHYKIDKYFLRSSLLQ